MSKTYTDLTETVFPEAVDTIVRMSDVSSSDITAVNQYYARYNAGDMTGAAQILLSNPGLQNKIFNAAKFNKLIDAVIAIQRYYKEDVKAEVEQFRHCGTYNATTAYKVGNIISHDGDTYICAEDCKGVTPGTNAAKWTMVMEGATTEQRFRGVYNSKYPYIAGNCVTYSGQIWQALQNCTNVEPGTDGNVWVSILSTGDLTNASGTLGIANGGTGATTAAGALSKLGAASKTHAAQHKTGGSDALKPSDIGAAAASHAARHKTGGADPIVPADIGAAAASHAAQHKAGGADAIAPADIGAAAASHAAQHKTGGSDALKPSDIGAAEADHGHTASKITDGEFAGTNVRAKTGTDYTTSRIRNIQASTTDLTAGVSGLPSGDIYLVYE